MFLISKTRQKISRSSEPGLARREGLQLLRLVVLSRW